MPFVPPTLENLDPNFCPAVGAGGKGAYKQCMCGKWHRSTHKFADLVLTTDQIQLLFMAYNAPGYKVTLPGKQSIDFVTKLLEVTALVTRVKAQDPDTVGLPWKHRKNVRYVTLTDAGVATVERLREDGVQDTSLVENTKLADLSSRIGIRRLNDLDPIG